MEKVIKKSLGNLKSKVTTADKLNIPVFHKEDVLDFRPQISTVTTWITLIEDYCVENNLLPEDLIAFHAAYNKSALNPKNGIK